MQNILDQLRLAWVDPLPSPSRGIPLAALAPTFEC